MQIGKLEAGDDGEQFGIMEFHLQLCVLYSKASSTCLEKDARFVLTDGVK